MCKEGVGLFRVFTAIDKCEVTVCLLGPFAPLVMHLQHYHSIYDANGYWRLQFKCSFCGVLGKFAISVVISLTS